MARIACGQVRHGTSLRRGTTTQRATPSATELTYTDPRFQVTNLKARVGVAGVLSNNLPRPYLHQALY